MNNANETIFDEVKTQVLSFIDIMKFFVPNAVVYATFEPFDRDHPSQWNIRVFRAGDKHLNISNAVNKLRENIKEKYGVQWGITYDVFMG